MASRDIPYATSITILSVTTSATGATWVAFGSQNCTYLDIVNGSGTAIEYRRGGAGEAIAIPDGASRLVLGVSNASAIEIRRVDQSNTQVAVKAEAIS